MEFRELNLHPQLQQGIADAGYISCMPVQVQVLNHAFGGQDLYVQSQTGTGKTAAFLIVIFQRLLSEPLLAGKKAIIMVPTRELAVQVEEEAKMLAKHLPFKIGSFYGGVGYTQQTKMLRENVQILVGTPGRVLDLNKSGQMNLMDIAFLVLDEADRMFDMGFYPDLRKLIKVVPPADRRQTMLFSATLNSWVKNLAWEYTKNPFEIEITPEIVTVEEVEQILYHVPSENKMRLLLGILSREKPESALIFCNTKRYAEIAAKRLRMNGYEVEFIIGDLPQSKRLKVIEDIKSGKLKLLVATDVAARGLDIEGLALVVNYDLPNEAENYVHRIGRTARAGKTGKAITLASEQDVYELPAIERYIGQKIPAETASEEFYAEDKSEGARIHVEFAVDERGRGSTGRRKEEYVRRGGSEGKHRDEKRSGTQGPGTAAKPGKDRDKRKPPSPPGKRPGTANPKLSGQKPGFERTGSGSSVAGRADVDFTVKNLASLTFEQRMAYYKQKYDKAGNTQKTQKNTNKNRHYKGQKQRQEKQDRSGQERKGQDAGTIEPEQNSVQNKVQEAPRKGMLQRLAGIFRKK